MLLALCSSIMLPSHLSQASVVDLSTNLANAQQNSDSGSSPLRSILAKLPLGGGSAETDEKLSQADVMKEKAQAYHFNPDDIAPAEVQQQMWELLVWRDSIYREVVGMIEMVPGLDSLIDTLTNTLNACEYSLVALSGRCVMWLDAHRIPIPKTQQTYIQSWRLISLYVLFRF